MNKLLLFLLLTPTIVFSQEEINLLILSRNYNEALQLIEKQIHENPDASLSMKKGIVLTQMQNYQEAVNAFSSALELQPNNPVILIELADALSTLGNHHDATSFYQKAVSLKPGNLSLAGKLGRNYIQRNEFRKAYTVFSEIYQADSSNVFWNKQFAFSTYQTGKKVQAIDLYEKVLELNPRDYTSYFNLIKLYQQTEQLAKALQTMEKGLEYFPGDEGFYLQQAKQFFAGKQYKDAQQAFDNYFTAGGDSIYHVLMNYGITLYFTGNETKSISILEHCAGQVANDPYVLFYLSLCHKKLVHYEIAEDYMNAAIESATPAYLPDMYHHLGQILGQQRKFEKSIAALKEANNLDPTAHEILFEIATTYEEFNSNKTLALNYYHIYLKEAGESAKNVNYALDRIERIKEDLFME